jgi:hypothetical protein
LQSYFRDATLTPGPDQEKKVQRADWLTAVADFAERNEAVWSLNRLARAARVVGRRSPKGRCSLGHVTFEEDAVCDQRDANGCIRLSALRLRLAARGIRPLRRVLNADLEALADHAQRLIDLLDRRPVSQIEKRCASSGL